MTKGYQVSRELWRDQSARGHPKIMHHVEMIGSAKLFPRVRGVRDELQPLRIFFTMGSSETANGRCSIHTGRLLRQIRLLFQQKPVVDRYLNTMLPQPIHVQTAQYNVPNSCTQVVLRVCIAIDKRPRPTELELEISSS